MKFKIYAAIGMDVFGLGIDLEWTREDACASILIGPLHVFYWTGWGLQIHLLGRRIVGS